MPLEIIKGEVSDLAGIILTAVDRRIQFTGKAVAGSNLLAPITITDGQLETLMLATGVLAVSPDLARRALRHPHLRRKIRRLLRRQARPHLRRHLQVWDLWPHPHLRLLRRLPEGWLLRSAQRRVFRRARNAPVGLPPTKSV